jgi:hypothetical protein
VCICMRPNSNMHLTLLTLQSQQEFEQNQWRKFLARQFTTKKRNSLLKIPHPHRPSQTLLKRTLPTTVRTR